MNRKKSRCGSKVQFRIIRIQLRIIWNFDLFRQRSSPSSSWVWAVCHRRFLRCAILTAQICTYVCLWEREIRHQIVSLTIHLSSATTFNTAVYSFSNCSAVPQMCPYTATSPLVLCELSLGCLQLQLFAISNQFCAFSGTITERHTACTFFWVLREFVSVTVGLFTHFTSVPKSITI